VHLGRLYVANDMQTASCITGMLQGEAARRIWDAIYTQSCFTNVHDNDTCTERRVFYRLISGERLCQGLRQNLGKYPRLPASLCKHARDPGTMCMIYAEACSPSLLLLDHAGMHASISAHLSNDYLLDEFQGRWGQNLDEFERRLGNPEVCFHSHCRLFIHAEALGSRRG